MKVESLALLVMQRGKKWVCVCDLPVTHGAKIVFVCGEDDEWRGDGISSRRAREGGIMWTGGEDGEGDKRECEKERRGRNNKRTERK